MPRRAGRTRTPVPSADSSASSARASAASWSGWGTTLGALARGGLLGAALGLADRPAARRGLAGERAARLVARAWRIARPWPSLSSPAASRSSTSSGRSRRRIRFEIDGAAAAQPPRQLLLAEPQILDQRRAGARLVDRVEVLARHVLDQRRLQALRLALVADDRGHRLQAGLPRRPPAALAGDQLVATVAQRADDQRLDDARVGQRRGQRLDRVGAEARSRLARVATDRLHRQLAQLGLARSGASGRMAARPLPIPGLVMTLYLNFSLRHLARARPTPGRPARARPARAPARGTRPSRARRAHARPPAGRSSGPRRPGRCGESRCET